MKYFMSLLFLYMQVNAFAQLSLQWQAQYNGTGDFNDRYTCISKDNAGNIYVGGSTVNPANDRDFLLQKISNSGQTLLNFQWNGSGSGPDEVTAITTDAQNNIYVTGLSQGLNTSTDYLTIKFNANGDTLWTRRYDFTAEYDQPNAIWVDNAGNVYVTGQSDSDSGTFTNDDYATVKYSPTGNLLWVKRFDGFGNALDRAVKIIGDNNGHIFITGRSDNGNDDDYVTICYDPAGTVLWTKYDDRGGRDRATDMILDAAGNILITGRSDNGFNDDYWTLKYNPAGSLIWQRAYDYLDDDRAIAISTDASNNVYITGQSDQDFSPVINWDIATIAYSSTGTQLWSKRFDGTGFGDDTGLAIAITNNKVIVAGTSDSDPGTNIVNQMQILAYNTSDGNVDWSNVPVVNGYSSTGCNAIAISQNNIFIPGFAENSPSGKDAVVVSYSTSGTPGSNYIFNGIGDNNDNIRDIEVAANGTVFTAGYSVGNGSNRDFTLLKFSALGTLDCSYQINGSAVGSEDDVQGLVLDNQDQPVVAGVIKESGLSNDWIITKVNNNCDTLWQKIYDDGTGGSDRIYDLTRDLNGNLYITGRMDGAAGQVEDDNCVTMKKNPNGTIAWTKTYDSGNSQLDRGIFVQSNTTGDVYVAGRSGNLLTRDIFLIKYNNTGVQQWVKTWSGDSGNDEPTGMSLDAAGNIYISGITESAVDSVYDIITLKYNASGTLVWEAIYNGDANENDLSAGITVFDKNGFKRIAVAGETVMSASQSGAMVTLVYDDDGNLTASYPYDQPSDDKADDIVVFKNYLLTAGHSNKGTLLAPDYDIVLELINPVTGIVNTVLYNGPGDASDIPNKIFVSGDNGLYIAGSTLHPSEQRNSLVLYYELQVFTENIATTESVKMYPNPVEDVLNIDLQDQPLNNNKLQLYDNAGRVVLSKELDDSVSSVSLNHLVSGIYIYKICNADSIIATGKINKN
jgi:uncharacterized delta-60 repeat protein